MPIADFIHLRVHSAYSLGIGAIKVKDLVYLAKKLNMPAVAVTDTGNLFGALEFSVAGSDTGVQPIIGCVLGIRPPVAEISRGVGRPPIIAEPEPVVLLCQSQKGYDNLMKLVSVSYMETTGNDAPQIPLAVLGEYNEGLLCLTGGMLGPVGQRLLAGDADAAEATLLKLKGYFGDRLYVELQRHGWADEDKIEGPLIDLAYAHDLALVATNDAYYPKAEFYEAHDVLMCSAQGVTVNAEHRKRLTPEHYFKPAEDMRKLFEDLPEACDNTLLIAKRCAYFVRKIKPILPPFPAESGRNEVDEMRVIAHEGLTLRLERQVLPLLKPEDDAEKVQAFYRERLDFELGVIERMGYPGYFLIVADFIQWAKRQGIPVGPGRGSGAGSVAAWALTITDIDPIRFGLFFERFLNPERVSMPDFDVDFCQDRRDEVIRYVQDKYGRDRVAQIITFMKLQARRVLRDVGRVLEMPYGQVDRICKMVPNNPAKPVTLQQAIDEDPQLKALQDSEDVVGRLISIALKLEGLNGNASTHAAGVVIGDRPLDKLVPLYRDPNSDMPVTQFNMKFVEDAGLVKFDFLGLKTLTTIDRAVRLVNKDGGDLDPLTMPLDDLKTFQMLARGETVGVFQFEGAGMRDLLKNLKPTKFEDLIAVVSLYRPGPMDSIPEYIAVKHGHQPANYMHDMLQPILEETYGVMTYQEQVMKIAQVMAGYTLGGADLLRRAMGKKVQAEMDAQRKTFTDGAIERGIDKLLADLVFDKMAKFAGYGFNKGHAAPYAFIAYQTAYLKANHPVAFMAATMSLDAGNTDKLNVFRQELQRQKVRLLPPDINKSGVEFTVEMAPVIEGEGQAEAVRYALSAIKGVGADAMLAIIAERNAKGPYKSLFDLAERLDTKQFNKRQFENLTKAGGFDSLSSNRAQTFQAAELLMRHAAVAAEERQSTQGGLFGGGGGTSLSKPAMPKTPDWPAMDRLQHEFEAIGFYLSAHPLDPYQMALKRLDVTPVAQLQARAARGTPGRIKLAGIVTGRKERTSARGSRFAFVALSDMSGMVEVTLFSEILAQSRALLDSGQPLLIAVDVKMEGGDVSRLTAQSVEALDQAAAGTAAGLLIRLTDASALKSLQELLAKSQGGPAGKAKLKLILPTPAQEVELALPGQYQIGAQLRQAMTAMPGIVELQDF